MTTTTSGNTIRYQVLGPIQVLIGSERQPLGAPQQQLVLGVLVAAAGRTVSTDHLIDSVWPEDPPATARKNLQGYIHYLRGIVGDALVTESGGYSLETGDEVDAVELENLIATARASSDPVAVATSYRRAVELWRGTPFDGLGEGDTFEPDRVRLTELYLSAVEGWYDARLKLGAVTDVLPAIEGSVAENPMRDRLRRQLMLALFRAGRQAEALRVFQDYHSELAELGLAPPAETVELERRISARDVTLLEVPTSSRWLRGYQLQERLGEGAFSVVYEAVQPSVDRQVAVKQIRAELANRPEFIRRFEAEAHMVARLEHPHIVPLIDFWREPGSAYLVMRLLKGGSLETSAADQRWPLDRTITMVEQIGAALGIAHRSGVVHRDVKSANILLDTDGNAYLTDFGIALEAADAADPAAALSAGSPAYASPEQLRRETVGPSADVHGLAIAMYEALTGRLPFPDEPNHATLLQRQLHDPIPLVRNSRADIPVSIDDVLQVATAKTPEDRYATIEEFISAVRGAAAPALAGSRGSGSFGRESATVITFQDRNPYKGLLSFDEADASDFAGRDRLVDQMASALDDQRVLTVVGPSGSGKSSAVRAGLLPELRRGRIIGSDEWFVVTITPGSRPFEELEAGLARVAVDQPGGLLEMLSDGERGISRAIRRVIPEFGVLLLVIDQFEEIFTLCPDEDERRLFLAGLASALADERSRLRVVLTLRADFYDRPLQYESVGRLVRDSTVTVLPLAADELERAIVDPALGVGAEFEPGLVSELVADVADQPGALPMLQYALTQLYDRRISGLMTRASYRELGGVAGALANKAEELHEESSPEEQLALRRVFGRLVTLGEGVEDTRRRALRSELAVSEAAQVCIDRFGDARLFAFDRDAASREPTVEVAHEALLREWPRLRGWLDEDRDDLRAMRHLSAAAADWGGSGRPESELYRGGRLETVEDWNQNRPGEFSAVEQQFVDASLERRAASNQAEKRTNSRLRRLLVGVGLIAVVALIAGVLAFQQKERAGDQTDLAIERLADAEESARQADQSAEVASQREAEARQSAAEAQAATGVALDQAFDSETSRLVAASGSLIADSPREALLAAVAAFRRVENPETLGALQRALVGSNELTSHVRWGVEYRDVDWVSEDRAVAVTPNAVELIDLTTNETLDSFAVNFADLSSLARFSQLSAASNDGRFFVVASDPGQVHLLTVGDSFEQVFTVQVDVSISGVSVVDDGRVVVVGSDNRVFGFDASGSSLFSIDVDDHGSWGAQVKNFPNPPQLSDFFDLLPVRSSVDAFDDSLLVASGSQLRRLTWSGAVSEGPLSITNSLQRVTSSPRLLHETETGDIVFHGATSFGRVESGTQLRDQIEAVAFEGNLGVGTPGIVDSVYRSSELITVLDDGSIVRFDARTGRRGSPIDLKVGLGHSISMNPRKTHVLLAHSGGLTTVALDQVPLLSIAVPRDPLQTVLSVTSDGGIVVAGPRSPGVPAALWQREVGAYRSIDYEVDGVEFFVAAGYGQAFVEWWYFRQTEDGIPIRDSQRMQVLVGDELEMATDRPQLEGFLVAEANLKTDLLVGLDERPLRVVATRLISGEELAVVELPDANEGARPGVSRIDPAGRRLLVASAQGQAWVYDIETWDLLDNQVIDSADIVLAHWNQSGSLLATASSTGEVSIRDGESFEIIKTLLGTARVANSFAGGSLFFSADDQTLLTNFDGPGRLWDLESGEQIGGVFPHESTLQSGGNFGEGGLQLVTGTESSILVWNLNTDEWVDEACFAAGSNLTEAEWQQWGPRDQDWYEICPTS